MPIQLLKQRRILGTGMFTEYEQLMCTISGSNGAAGKSGSDKEKPKFDIHRMGLIQGMVNWLTNWVLNFIVRHSDLNIPAL